MAENSKIEWCHHSANLWHGCTEVHAGCDNCYARVLSRRWKRDLWGNDVPRMVIKSVWNDLARYQKLAAAAGEVHRVFVGSMMDIFEKSMPVIDSKGNEIIDYSDDTMARLCTGELRARLFDEISQGEYNNLQFLFLTKRPSNINKYIPDAWKENPPANVMFGTSPVNQETADKLIPQLFQVTGNKFLSVEPMLGPIDLLKEYPVGKGSVPYGALLEWVICGGESGSHARPMHPDWARDLRDQCKEVGVPFFFKQWGEYVPGQEYIIDAVYVEGPEKGKPAAVSDNPVEMRRVGKKAAGRLLDDVLHNEYPKFLNHV